MDEKKSFTMKVVITAAVVILFVAAVVLVVYAINFFFLVFAGILFAVMLRAMTNWLHAKTGLPHGLGLAISTLFFFGTFYLIGMLIAPTIQEQVQELKQTLPEAIGSLEQQIGEYRWGERALDEISGGQDSMVPDTQELLARAGNIFTSTLGIIMNILIIIIVGIFFAAAPQTYQMGIVSLFPPRHRTRVWEVLDKCYYILKWWLFGKLLTMVAVGIMTYIGLLLLGVPLPAALAVIAFFLDFIPNIGPIIASVPAILLALLDGPMMALYVAILYFVVQSIESYLLVPIIYQKTVSISPVVTLLSLVLFGILVGPLGLILAAPLIAVIQVLIKEFYIKDYLEKGARETAPVASPQKAEPFSGNKAS
jgi:predicted PurR-regulated permease PerM